MINKLHKLIFFGVFLNHLFCVIRLLLAAVNSSCQKRYKTSRKKKKEKEVAQKVLFGLLKLLNMKIER
jgi:hypothetical protein